MTEEEAKTKWCPFVRYTPEAEGHHAFDNRGCGLGNPEARCIASACMAWRWSGDAIPAQHYLSTDLFDAVKRSRASRNEGWSPCPQPPERPSTVPDHWERDGGRSVGEWPCWQEPQADADARRVGRCGLAGAPQP